MLSMTIFTLQTDIKRAIDEDSFCIFRGYIAYLAAALQNHSFALRAIYRYASVVYPFMSQVEINTISNLCLSNEMDSIDRCFFTIDTKKSNQL